MLDPDHGAWHPRVLQHRLPVWADRADARITVELPDVDDSLEQLVVRRVSEETFELCCLPFTLYDVSLGDIVRVAGLSASSPGRIAERVTSNGHCLFRVAITAPERVTMPSASSSFLSMGYLVEEYGTMLLAIDALDADAAQLLGAYLEERQNAGEWEFERASG